MVTGSSIPQGVRDQIANFTGPISLPPIDFTQRSAAQSGIGQSESLDLIQPVITLDFGSSGGRGGAATTADRVINNLAKQTEAITAKGTVLGDLGITPSILFIVVAGAAVALVIAIIR